MEILLLEDDIRFLEAYENYFLEHDLHLTKRLLDFDYFLFNEPGIEKYDYIIMDLAIQSDDTTVDEIRTQIPEIQNITPIKVNGNIPLLGWDYYINKITENEKSKPYLNKFILISGHTIILRKIASEADLKKSHHLIDKSDAELYNKIQKIFYKR